MSGKTEVVEANTLRNRTMAGVGGSIIVALEAARDLNLADVATSAFQIDPLEIERMATKLGVPGNLPPAGAPTAAPPE